METWPLLFHAKNTSPIMGKFPTKTKGSVKCGWIFQMAGRTGDDVDYMHHPNNCGGHIMPQRHPDLTTNECHAQHGTLFFRLNGRCINETRKSISIQMLQM